MLRTHEKLLILALPFLFPRESFAYLDPGTGSYIIQMVIGAFLGGIFALKIYWRKLKSYLSGKGKSDEAAGK